MSMDTVQVVKAVSLVRDDNLPASHKLGRKARNVWEMFTSEELPEKKKSAVCKNCNLRVNYYKKTKSVIVHLKRFTAFKKLSALSKAT